MVPPLLFLALMLALTASGWFGYKLHRHLRKSALRRLATEWQMRFVPEDRFAIARRIASQFPEPNASDLLVMDLIYGTLGDRHRYVFTVEYTATLDTGHRRRRRVMTVHEPREHAADTPLSPPVTAPDDLPVVEQYEFLRSRGWETA